MTDLTQLPAPSAVEVLDFETILAACKADLLARYPEVATVLDLESEPLVKLLEVFAYREMLFRARVNEAARAHLLAFATDADLDHLGALFGVTRLAGEKDDRLRLRIQLQIAALAGQGTKEHYEFVAMTADLNVRSAYAMQPAPGRVRVLLWLQDASLQTATLTTVEGALNAENARMLGVPVSVGIAQPSPINITARITRERTAPSNLLAQLNSSLAPAFDAFARLGRDVARSWITTLLHVKGVAAVDYPQADAPAASTPLAADEYPVLGLVTLIDAGVAQ